MNILSYLMGSFMMEVRHSLLYYGLLIAGLESYIIFQYSNAKANKMCSEMKVTYRYVWRSVVVEMRLT